MADKLAVSGPVDVRPDSSDRVAFELMHHIAAWENQPEDKKRTRDYWLQLFFQCKQASQSHYLGNVLNPE